MFLITLIIYGTLKQGEHPKGGGRAAACPQIKIQKKKCNFVDTMISNTLRDLTFSLNQPLKSVDDRYIGILKNKTKNLVCLREN
jgi:hypothetical protein